MRNINTCMHHQFSQYLSKTATFQYTKYDWYLFCLDIIGRVRNGETPPFRPMIPKLKSSTANESVVDMRLVDLMQQCWLEDLHSRDHDPCDLWPMWHMTRVTHDPREPWPTWPMTYVTHDPCDPWPTWLRWPMIHVTCVPRDPWPTWPMTHVTYDPRDPWLTWPMTHVTRDPLDLRDPWPMWHVTRVTHDPREPRPRWLMTCMTHDPFDPWPMWPLIRVTTTNYTWSGWAVLAWRSQHQTSVVNGALQVWGDQRRKVSSTTYVLIVQIGSWARWVTGSVCQSIQRQRDYECWRTMNNWDGSMGQQVSE